MLPSPVTGPVDAHLTGEGEPLHLAPGDALFAERRRADHGVGALGQAQLFDDVIDALHSRLV